MADLHYDFPKNEPLLTDAVAEAERFLRRVKALRDAYDRMAAAARARGNDPLFYDTDHGVERAAVKRASLDLTRALARYRRG